MNRENKAKFVSDFLNDYQSSEAVFALTVNGLTVNQLQTLRGSLRQNGAKLKVGKIRLIKIALQKDADAAFLGSIEGQVGAVFSPKDSQLVAKSLVEFGRTNEALKFVSGSFKHKFMTADGIKGLAAIPSQKVLYAQLANVLNAPIASLARGLKAVADK